MHERLFTRVEELEAIKKSKRELEEELKRIKRDLEISSKMLILPPNTSVVLSFVPGNAVFHSGSTVRSMENTVKVKGSLDTGENVTISSNLEVGEKTKLGNNTTIHGNIVCKGPIKLGDNVKVNGDIKSSGNLVTGENTQITGRITVEGSITLGPNNKVQEHVECKGRITIGREAQLKNVKAEEDITIGDNSVLNSVNANGSLKTGKNCKIKDITAMSIYLGEKTHVMGDIEYKGALQLEDDVLIDGRIHSRRDKPQTKLVTKKPRPPETTTQVSATPEAPPPPGPQPPKSVDPNILEEVTLRVIEAPWSDGKRPIVRIDPEILEKWSKKYGLPPSGYRVRVKTPRVEGYAFVYPIENERYIGRGLARVTQQLRETLRLGPGDQIHILLPTDTTKAV
ncbi:MAG: hypothetical protein DRO11_09620 [Methanobacteriota archaeon]|nr:MAG: hypothetical protein DRO11_09620 [Euryarchaeota archaeon]